MIPSTILPRPMLMAIALAVMMSGPAQAGPAPQGTSARPLLAPIQPQAAGDCPAASTTNLLFPFVTNQAGFDSGVAISNTSADPFGTAGSSGTCRLHYYGNTTGGGAAPASQTTTSPIAPGTHASFTSAGTPMMSVRTSTAKGAATRTASSIRASLRRCVESGRSNGPSSS